MLMVNAALVRSTTAIWLCIIGKTNSDTYTVASWAVAGQNLITVALLMR